MYNFFYFGKTLIRGEKMEKKLSLRKEVKITFYLLLVLLVLLGTYAIGIRLQTAEDVELVDYVPCNNITTQDLPVIKEEVKLLNPYTDNNVKIGKYYYDYKSDKAKQEQSITENDSTYMQNSGLDFVANDTFDVVSSLDGEVTNVKEDDLLGKVVEIKHDNKYITIYQSLSEVSVKKGDKVMQGQIIGKSGTNELDSEIGNHLHYELYINGKVVNPEEYLNKVIEEDKTP